MDVRYCGLCDKKMPIVAGVCAKCKSRPGDPKAAARREARPVLLNCQHCGHSVANDAKACPGCGSVSYAEESHLKTTKSSSQADVFDSLTTRDVLVGALVIFLLAWWLWPEPAQPPRQSRADDIERYKRHTIWNIERLIKARLKDPDSYKTNTAYTLVNDDQGVIGAVITYRAKNGFGGYSEGLASGNCNMQAKDCKIITLR